MRVRAAALALALSSCARAHDAGELSRRVDSLAEQLTALRQIGTSNYEAIQRLSAAVQLEVQDNDELFQRLDVRLRNARAPRAGSPTARACAHRSWKRGWRTGTWMR